MKHEINNPIFLTDGSRIDVDSFAFNRNELLFLLENGIVEFQEGYQRINYVGLFYLADKLFLVFPKTVRLSDVQESWASYSKSLIRSLIKFSKEAVSDELTSLDGATSKLPLDKLKLYLALLDDYRQHGIVKFNDVVITKNSSGKINWKRTINSSVPFFNHKNVPIYTELRTKKNLTLQDELISNIHRSIIAHIDRLLGWYFCPAGKRYIAAELVNYSKLPCTVEIAINVLRLELREEFETRKIVLYKDMIRILSDQNFFQLGHLLGVSDYWRVWEKMCKNIFDDVYDDKYSRSIPQPKYQNNEGINLSIAANIGQRFDLIAERAETLFLIDTKYYDTSKSLPGWKDLVKQFFYYRSLHLITTKKIINILMFPDHHDLSCKPERVEMVEGDIEIGIDKLKEAFPPIICSYFDIWEVIDLYLKGTEEEKESLYRNLLNA